MTLLSVTTDDETPHDEPLRQIEVGNEWAVPYNPYFSSQFDSHFNAVVLKAYQMLLNTFIKVDGDYLWMRTFLIH